MRPVPRRTSQGCDIWIGGMGFQEGRGVAAGETGKVL